MYVCMSTGNNWTNLMSINMCVTTNAMAPPHEIRANGLIRGNSNFAKPGTT